MNEWPLIASSSPRAKGRDQSGWMLTVAVAAAMLGWLLVLTMVGALVPDSNRLPIGQPLVVGRGVTILPAPGWSRGPAAGISDSPEVEGLSLQKGGVRAVFIVEPFEGATERLHELYLQDLADELERFESLEPADVAMGLNEQGMRSVFRGWTRGTLLEGILASLSHQGSGVSCIAFGSAGEVLEVLPDLDLMLETMGLPE